MANKLKMRDLWKNSCQNQHQNGWIAYILFFFSTLLACGFLASYLLLESLVFIVVPLVAIPLFFACQAATRLMRQSANLTLRGFFGCYLGYFSEHFNSTFRVIRSMLFALIFYGATLLTSIIVTSSCFYAFNYLDFRSLIDSFTAASLYSSLDGLFEQYSSAINMYLLCTTYPPMAVFSFVFIYFLDRNSISLFLRLDKQDIPGRYLGSLNDLVVKHNKKYFNKAYLCLNWPFYLLFIIGFGLGSYLGYLYSFDATSLLTFGVIVALALSFILYGPTLLANKETIYNSLKEEYVRENEQLRERVNGSIKELLDQLQKLDEETKKDSDES